MIADYIPDTPDSPVRQSVPDTNQSTASTVTLTEQCDRMNHYLSLALKLF